VSATLRVMARFLVPLAILLALITLSVWSDRPLPKADLTIVERDPVHTLDPAQISFTQDIRVARAVYEGLLRADVLSLDQKLEPAAAESLPAVSEDGLVYTFRIRADALWSTGDPVLASDFVYAWRRVILPDTAADYSDMFNIVRGAKAWAERRRDDLAKFEKNRDVADRAGEAKRLLDDAYARFASDVGIRATDARTIRIELTAPLPYFLDLVAFVPFFPLHEKSVSAYESLDAATGRLSWTPGWTKPPALVGNGPYSLTLWRFQRDMRLERNPNYHDSSLPKLPTLSIVNIADPNAMVTAFRTGAVDWTTDVLVPYRPEMIAEKAAFDREHAEERAALAARGVSRLEVERAMPPDPRNRIQGMPSFGTYFLSFNCTPTLPNGRPNPLADARVRRALAMSAEKREVVENLRRSGEPIAGSLTPPGSLAGYTPPAGLPFDPAAARQELADAGYPGGSSLPPLEFMFSRDGGHDLIAATLKRGWEKHLGITVELVQLESRVASSRLKGRQYMIGRSSWFGDYADPTTFLDIHLSGNNNNDRGYSSVRFDGLMMRAGEERDPAARFAALAEAEKLVVETDAAVLPLFHYTQFYLFDPKVLTGLSTHPRQAQHLFLLDRLDREGAR
jgi:oligopeptide transport system substrate-binding protein